ncbi:hypothetical protein A2U01_0104594, partial [Trifolium medium]|nr:hypothetical protein [Trifolium medium]
FVPGGVEAAGRFDFLYSDLIIVVERVRICSASASNLDEEK